MTEAEQLVKNLLSEVQAARNLFHDTLIRTITCEHVYTVEDVISLLISEDIWVEYKRAGTKKFILRLEWSN